MGKSESLAWLRRALGVRELDGAMLRSSAPRTVTQSIARLGDEFRLWAVFEPYRLRAKKVAKISASDPELVRALALHGITWVKSSRRR